MNQIVVCANQCRTPSKVSQILSHELVHMFDFCTAQIDFRNLSHLACTEVRAANLVHCRREDLLDVGWTSRTSCVKKRAARSVEIIGGVSSVEALEAVEQVFEKCSRDLEPVGRIPWTRKCEHFALREYMHLYGSQE